MSHTRSLVLSVVPLARFGNVPTQKARKIRDALAAFYPEMATANDIAEATELSTMTVTNVIKWHFGTGDIEISAPIKYWDRETHRSVSVPRQYRLRR